MKKWILSLSLGALMVMFAAPAMAATYEPGPTPVVVTASETDPIPPL